MPFLYEFTIDNEKVEGQIGFSTSRKWEEALDEATLVIPFTYENNTPYKMFSMLNIEISEINNYIDRNTIDTREYEFIIYSDTVESLGSYGYYRHNVSAIEYTAKLDYYMINNLSKSRSVLKNTQAPFETHEIAASNEFLWYQKVTLENIGLKEDFYANKDLVIDSVYEAYVADASTPGFKRTGAVIRTNATLVSGTSPHTLSTSSATWVFPTGEWEIEYGFIADGTEGYGYDVGFNPIYTFYVEALDQYNTTMYDVVNEIRESVSKYGGIEDTIYFDSTRIFDISAEDETYLKSVQAPQIYMNQATARQMLIYTLSFVNMLPRLVNGTGIDALTFERYNLDTGTFTVEDVIAYGSKQNTNQIGTRNYQPITQALANNLDDTSVHSPSRSGYQQVRSLDIQLTADNFTIKLPEKAPLYMPKKLIVVIPQIEVFSSGGTARILNLVDFELDLTPRWINDEEWKLKEITTNFPSIDTKWIWNSDIGLRENKVENLTWKVGDTHINLSTIFGTLFESNLIVNVIKMAIFEYVMLHPPSPLLLEGTPGETFDASLEMVIDIPSLTEYKDWRFRVEYITDERLVIKQDKEDLTQVSFYSEMRQNQEQALVNIVRQSRKGYGDLQRTGNITFSFPKKHISFSEFYEVGQKDSDDYTITQIDTQWNNDYAIATYTVIKYHNRIQQATFVNQKYRPFDNFAKSVLNRHEHYGDYLIALPPNDTDSGVQEQNTKIYSNDNTVRTIVGILLGNDFGLSPEKSATVALVRTDGMLDAYPEGSPSNKRYFIVSPLTSRGIKGGFAFTLGFQNNQIAGDGLVEETISGTPTWYNQAVRYTDKKGRFTRFGFSIMKDLDFDSVDDLTFPLIENLVTDIDTYFEDNAYFWCGYYLDNVAFKYPLVWNKDPMTNAQLTYQLNVSSYYMGLYIFGLKFFTENYIVKDFEILNGAELYLYNDGTTKYEMFEDLFVKSGYSASVTLRDDYFLGDGNIEYDDTTNTVSFIGISMTNITAWAIGIENDDGDIDLILACNEGLSGVKFVKTHFRPNVLEIGNITTISEYTLLNFALELSVDMVYVGQDGIPATIDCALGLGVVVEFFRDDSVPLDIILGLDLDVDMTYVKSAGIPLTTDLSLTLTNDIVYVRGGEVDLISDFGLILTNTLEHHASKDIGAIIDNGMTLTTTLDYVVGGSVQNTLDLGLSFSNSIVYLVGLANTINSSLELSNTITFIRDNEFPLDLGLEFDTNMLYRKSKNIGLDVDLGLEFGTSIIWSKNIAHMVNSSLETSFDVQYARSLEVVETLDIEMNLSFDIQYTVYEPQYASPTVEVGYGILGTDGDGDFYEIIYRVRNVDSDTGRVGHGIFNSAPSGVTTNMVELTSNEWSDYIEERQYYTSGTPKLYAQTRDVLGEDDKEISEIVVWDSWS
jgi:hypothetical protein